MQHIHHNNIELSDPSYIPVIRESITYYGGSQMWFPDTHWFSTDYILHYYGGGTIATADFILYLTLRNQELQTPVTESALQSSKPVVYNNYLTYVKKIHASYTKTHRYLAVPGPKIASAINSYASHYHINLEASWKWTLSYYDMYDMIETMLAQDLPVILSIGANTPNPWGKRGISFYERREINYPADTDATSDTDIRKKPYYYRSVFHNICGQYVTVTAMIKDDMAGKIMLRISSWGRQYYLDYEEFREYIDSHSTTLTSSLIDIKLY